MLLHGLGVSWLIERQMLEEMVFPMNGMTGLKGSCNKRGIFWGVNRGGFARRGGCSGRGRNDGYGFRGWKGRDREVFGAPREPRAMRETRRRRGYVSKRDEVLRNGRFRREMNEVC